MNFRQYWEMAQSYDVSPDTRLDLDAADLDFINLAGKLHKISPGVALRARYTTLLQDQVPNGGSVRFQLPGRRGIAALPMPRTNLTQLIAKLRKLGLDQTIEHGLKQYTDQDIANWLKRGYLVLDYQALRNVKARAVDWETFGQDLDFSRLPISKRIWRVWEQHSDEIERQIEQGISWAIGRCYQGEYRNTIYNQVLARVLIEGDGNDEKNPGQPVILSPNWVMWKVRSVATSMIRKQYGAKWKKVCFAA